MQTLLRPPDERELAAQAAERAAAAATIEVVELDRMEDLEALSDVLCLIWGKPAAEPIVPLTTLRALTVSGNYVCGAYSEGRLVGGIVGFLGRHRDAEQLHSHVLGVSEHMRGRSVGFALKQHQRAWALRRGVEIVTWTFDPLVRRNAYFNITKLGAAIVEYYPAFYGEMADGINSGDLSDRVLVEWSLVSDAARAASTGLQGESGGTDGASSILAPDGGMVPITKEPIGDTLVAWIPEDIVDLRRVDPALARRWRLKLREALTGALSDGYVVTGMTRSGHFVLRRRGGRQG